MHELIQQFKDSDKIVIVNPVWNYSFPSVLKAYIDIIINIGETVKRADNGLRDWLD
ncbi:NAD(P)H-dependent oxidoreductase [Paenibacillus sp. DCT19]|uniref:NAD(P)H-dependent oxidoreductase n=1 Tax=Paenibacillus sp. DCT19 TaxID=2211212 RepID=UPI0020C30435|nr:NAD(P)H-dependent oxidoreductase [Paenibacillus sp. DCT19]